MGQKEGGASVYHQKDPTLTDTRKDLGPSVGNPNKLKGVPIVSNVIRSMPK